MKAEQARQLADEALANLIAALEAGKSDALRSYLSVMSRFHEYSWGNIMLIMLQMPSASRVAGFHTWRKLGRFVRKGEKGIAIIAPMRIKSKQDDSTVGDDEREESFLRFKGVHVFDVSQTDGEPLPEFAPVTGDPAEHTDRLKAFVSEKGIVLEYAASLGGASGLSYGGRIELLSGLPAAEEFSVLVHELAHELLHKGERRRETTKTIRETEAEAVAFVVSQAIGLETGTRSADYIQLYNGDKATLAQSLDFIQKVSAEIIAELHVSSELANAA